MNTDYIIKCVLANSDLRFDEASEYTTYELLGHICNTCCSGDILVNLYYRWYKQNDDNQTLDYTMKVLYDKEWKNNNWEYITKKEK